MVLSDPLKPFTLVLQGGPKFRNVPQALSFVNHTCIGMAFDRSRAWLRGDDFGDDRSITIPFSVQDRNIQAYRFWMHLCSMLAKAKCIARQH